MVSNASNWLTFFVGAGVPSTTAATYAHVFYENRIQMDMLIDLNKEYLREMGITPMGDIIAILRHAKNVYEQNARDKVLLHQEAKIPVATVSASPLFICDSSGQNRMLRSEVTALPNSGTTGEQLKQARRVLPEHEGRYKITLPSGTTPKSKEILAKKALLYSDKEEKIDVFNRLQHNKSEKPVQHVIRVSGIEKLTSSVFARLGDKKTMEVAKSLSKPQSQPHHGILKNSAQQIKSGLIKKNTKFQKVLLVKKQPAKAATMVADGYETHKYDTGEKSVSFSSEDEILEIEPRKMYANPHSNILNLNVKARLGTKTTTASNNLLHRTRKVVDFKPDTSNILLKKSNVMKMKSDELMHNRPIPVHSRLSLNRKVNIVPERKISNFQSKGESISSVFDRLGFS